MPNPTSANHPPRVLLGVSGGIAAYKAAELVRALTTDLKAEVQVVMTPAAQEFVAPLTFQALSGRPVRMSLFDSAAEAAMGHIELARWGDVLIVAPATADFLARQAAGIADDLLTTLILASAAPKAVAPAMNQQMWASPATQRNVEVLRGDGVQIWGPDSGEQACGDVGAGRMLEPRAIAERVAALLREKVLAGTRVLITAGPTREAIDPVRYLSNHSSGKQGFALARAAAAAGARVTLVSGPVELPTPAGVTRIDVVSAADMLDACRAELPGTDIVIGVAAVADYRVAAPAAQKIKKASGENTLRLELVQNPDVIAEIARHPSRPFCVGFAAETENVAAHARAKLADKGLALIVANDVSRPDIGFAADDNAVTIIDAGGEMHLPAMPKPALAECLIDIIAERYRLARGSGDDS